MQYLTESVCRSLLPSSNVGYDATILRGFLIVVDFAVNCETALGGALVIYWRVSWQQSDQPRSVFER